VPQLTYLANMLIPVRTFRELQDAAGAERINKSLA